MTFETPRGALFAVAVVAPTVAFALASSRAAKGRRLLGLAAPPFDHGATLVTLAAVPLLLGLAAAGPSWRSYTGRRVRTDAQAVFVFDTSRSMAASASRNAPTRFAQAQAAAIRLRETAIPEVPAGVASLTTQLLPHLFPTQNDGAFRSTVEEAIGVEKPPPPFFKYGFSGTTFEQLTSLANQGYFTPKTTHRFAILLTDGESGIFDPVSVGQALAEPAKTAVPFQIQGRPAVKPEAPVKLFIIRIGGAGDRVYRSDGSFEVAYRPDPRAGAIVDDLAADARGQAFVASDLRAAAAALRSAVGSGHTSLRGMDVKTTPLAPYLVLLAFAPLLLIVRRRNLRQSQWLTDSAVSSSTSPFARLTPAPMRSMSPASAGHALIPALRRVLQRVAPFRVSRP
jgi:hypothetical protein